MGREFEEKAQKRWRDVTLILRFFRHLRVVVHIQPLISILYHRKSNKFTLKTLNITINILSVIVMVYFQVLPALQC